MSADGQRLQTVSNRSLSRSEATSGLDGARRRYVVRVRALLRHLMHGLSDAMKERGLRSSWVRPGGMLGVLTFHDEGGP